MHLRKNDAVDKFYLDFIGSFSVFFGGTTADVGGILALESQLFGTSRSVTLQSQREEMVAYDKLRQELICPPDFSESLRQQKEDRFSWKSRSYSRLQYG